MRETLLHFLWKTKRFDTTGLVTTDGQPIQILYPGEYNTHAGPDFFNARIRLGETLWAGNIEMHISASEWMAHGHDSDPAYDNVVLHVVLTEDRQMFHRSGEKLPCLALRDRIPPGLLSTYYKIEFEQAGIPCRSALGTVSPVVRQNWMDRLLVERLERKTHYVNSLLQATDQHWDESLYKSLARSFGLTVNVAPFETLARSLPWLVLNRYKNELLQLEALVFGQAGMLQADFQEEYPQTMAREFRHLARKFSLHPMDPHQWKFMRLRPANFPTVRLAQFAALWHQSNHLFSEILETGSIAELESLFAIPAGVYWDTHYLFDKPAPLHPKTPGRLLIHNLIVNSIVPFLFHYGKVKSMPKFQEKALLIMEGLPPESNVILQEWAKAGWKPWNAGQAQALLQLKSYYCSCKKCLDCAIGNAILR